MKSHTSLVAQEIRLGEWAELIKDCRKRSQGMKINEQRDILHKKTVH